MTSFAEVEATPVVSPRARRRRLLVKRFMRRPFAVAGLAVAIGFVLMAVFAPILAPYDPNATDFDAILEKPSWEHLLGTDELGRDVLSRIIFGARASILAGVFATLLAIVIAVPIGLVAGFYRGWIDPVISRLTDVLLAFPFLILAVGLAAILGPSLTNATLALGLAAAPGLIRVARAEALSLREEDYVRAAVANGAGDVRILGRHVVPNMTGTLIVQATVTIPAAIIGEAALSFLGLGVQPPTPSWGNLIASGRDTLVNAPWVAAAPGVTLALVVVGATLLGDAVRDRLDPAVRR
jgi:peptide/nickel transport system permease protein